MVITPSEWKWNRAHIIGAHQYWNLLFLVIMTRCGWSAKSGGFERRPCAAEKRRRKQQQPDTMTLLPLFRRLLPRLLHPRQLRPAPACVAAALHLRAVSSGGMFESLTGSMGAAFKKLLGRKTLTREEVDVALASVHDALVDADVAQV